MNGRKLMISCMLLLVCSPAFAQTVTYVHTDALGSLVLLTDANRNVVERREYEPYGRQLTPAPQDGPGYTGHVYDAATGMVYMQQRYYDPSLGRFLSVDPVSASSFGDNFNRYWYANNSPHKFIDPDGRRPSGALCERISRCRAVIQVNPSASGNAGTKKLTRQTGNSFAQSNSQAQYSTMVASALGAADSVAIEETKNAAEAFADEFTMLVEIGLIRPNAASLLIKAGAHGVNAAGKAYDLGALSSGLSGNTLIFAQKDIGFYINYGRQGPTHRYYPTTLINWGRVDWRPFDPGLESSRHTIWINFLNGAQSYGQER